MRDYARLFLICSLLGLAACSEKDWHAEAITNAEDKMRGEVNDPTATFSRVQLTSDSLSAGGCPG